MIFIYCCRIYLSPRTPIKNVYKNNIETKNQLSPFNIDTPNRQKILKDGFPIKCGTFLGSGGFGIVYKALYKGTTIFLIFFLILNVWHI